MEIYKINDNKFKSIYVSYNFTMEVKDTNIFSLNAVLASLMAKSSKKYNTQKEIEKYLNSLYGSNFDINIEKLGDLYNLEFRIEFINKNFLPNKEELLEKILIFLEEMIYNPAEWSIENIEREKKFIIERISERKDEKLKYGIQRAEELLCKEEPFGMFLYGEKETIESITKEEIIKYYNNLINSPVTIIISGNLDNYEDIEDKLKLAFEKYNKNSIKVEELNYNVINNFKSEQEEVKEYQDTTQSVLSMGLRINNVTPKDFYAINIYNAILGTTPSSKLFQNVREKESLAYTVRSRYYRFKNILVIYAGINKENYQKALDLIVEQINDIKNGKITDTELASAKDSLLADLLEWKDSKVAMAKMKIANIITFKNKEITIDNMRENIQRVTLQDVIDIANKVTLEKIFLLGGEDNA